MTSLHDLRFSPPPNSKSRLRLCIKPCAICIPDTGCCIFVLLRAPSLVVAYNIAKKQNVRCNVSSPKFLSYGSMEWNMEENFSMEMEYGRKFSSGMEDFWYGMEMEWKKIASLEYGKIVFHSIPRPASNKRQHRCFFSRKSGSAVF